MKALYVTAAVLFGYGTGVAADAAIQVVGNSKARVCYEAASSRNTGDTQIVNCTNALADDLSQHDTVATYVNRGILQMHRDRLDMAIADFDKAIGMDGREAEAFLNKGVALLKRGDGDQAHVLFDSALDKRTSKPELAYLGRGMASELGGDLKAAYLDYKRAVEIAPKWDVAARELSRFTVRRGSS